MARNTRLITLMGMAVGGLLAFSASSAHAEGVEVWAWYQDRAFNNKTGIIKWDAQVDIWVDGTKYPVYFKRQQTTAAVLIFTAGQAPGCEGSATVNGNTVKTHCWGHYANFTCPQRDFGNRERVANINNFGIEIIYADGRQKWLNQNCRWTACSQNGEEKWAKTMECFPP